MPFQFSICTRTNEARRQAIKDAVGKEYNKLGSIKYVNIYE